VENTKIATAEPAVSEYLFFDITALDAQHTHQQESQTGLWIWGIVLGQLA
jgi:hypothetical protein